MRKEKIKQKFTFYIISNAILSGQHSFRRQQSTYLSSHSGSSVQSVDLEGINFVIITSLPFPRNSTLSIKQRAI